MICSSLVSLALISPVRLGDKSIALKLCKNVLIRDVSILQGGHFAILVTGCDNLTVDNVTMDTDPFIQMTGQSFSIQ